MYRQGDILLAPTTSANSKEIPPGPRGHVLVRGATGHSHIVRGAKMFEGDDGGRVVVAVESFALVHETDAGVETGEHAILNIPAGTYLVIQQSQYRGEVRDVED